MNKITVSERDYTTSEDEFEINIVKKNSKKNHEYDKKSSFINSSIKEDYSTLSKVLNKIEDEKSERQKIFYANAKYNKIPLKVGSNLKESYDNKSNYNTNGNSSKISTRFYSREFKDIKEFDREKDKEYKINLSSSFRKNFDNNSQKNSCCSMEKKFRHLKDEAEIKIRTLKDKNKNLEDEIKSLKIRLDQEKRNSRKFEDNLRNSDCSSGIINIKELEILREKISQAELENEHLTFKHQEELNKTSEKFFLFNKICRKFLIKLKNIYSLFMKIEEKNIKSIFDNKEKIFIEIKTVLDEFEKTINDPNLINELKTENVENKFYEIFEKNDQEHLTKIFNFIDIILKLELTNKKLLDQNDLLGHKIKHETINFEEKYNEEIARLQRKIIEERLQKEESENSLLYIKQLNKDLENKMITIDQENIKLKKNVKNANERISEYDFMKTKISNLENEIKYKESIILYLENILKSNKIASSDYFINEEIFSNSNQFIKNNQNFSDAQLNVIDPIMNKRLTFKDQSESKEKKNSQNNSNNNGYEDKNLLTLDPENRSRTLDYSTPIRNLEMNHNTISYNSAFVFSENNHNYNSLSRNNSLKNEIDNLDMEIKLLQNKLKVMIDDKQSDK